MLPLGFQWPLTKAPRIRVRGGGGFTRWGFGVVGAWILSILSIRSVMLGAGGDCSVRNLFFVLVLDRSRECLAGRNITLVLGWVRLSSPSVRIGVFASAAGSYCAGICLGGPDTNGSMRFGPR